MSTAGRTQEIVQGVRDTLRHRFLLGGVPQTPTAATVTIYSPGGSVLVTAAAATIGGSDISYSGTWPAATYPYDEHYRAVWACAYGALDYFRVGYFDVVAHAFRSLLTDTDLTDAHPNLLDLSSASDFSKQRAAAWAAVRARVRNQVRRPAGFVTNPEIFFEAHLHLALSNILRDHVSRSAGDVEQERADFHEARAREALEVAFGQIDLDTSEDMTIEDVDAWGTNQVSWVR